MDNNVFIVENTKCVFFDVELKFWQSFLVQTVENKNERHVDDPSAGLEPGKIAGIYVLSGYISWLQ